jgi:hypothetical protein
VSYDEWNGRPRDADGMHMTALPPTSDVLISGIADDI